MPSRTLANRFKPFLANGLEVGNEVAKLRPALAKVCTESGRAAEIDVAPLLLVQFAPVTVLQRPLGGTPGRFDPLPLDVGFAGTGAIVNKSAELRGYARTAIAVDQAVFV